ncbi:DUF1992 domain-containing protein [Paenibacillus chartarius]|uniref:DUF1992 domain-containing protein n=1 Tax=Paenibacillus chartarius TaxID=747481 RepID=A0ABV6DV41_9BACL
MPEPPQSPNLRRRGAAGPRSSFERPAVPLPADVLEDRDAADAADRRVQQWVDEAYEECVRRGGFDNLPGWGKPLVVPTGDPLESMMKNAGVQPPWLLLRSETQKLLERAVDMAERTPADAPNEELDELIGYINKLIGQMNEEAPSINFHRSRVTRQTLAAHYEKWK